MRRIGATDRSQIASFSATEDFPTRLASAFAVVTDWSAAMAGSLRLEHVVETLGRILGATHLAAFRLADAEPRPSPIVAVDRRTPPPDRPERMTGSLARFVTDHMQGDLLPGKIFRLADLVQDPRFAGHAADLEWRDRPDIQHISLVVLGRSEGESDFLEILYDHQPDFNVDIPTAVIAIALAEAWALRSPGLVLGLIAKYGIRNRLRPELFRTHILSPDNPYALSRSQQRVCQLLAAGQKPAAIADLMKVSITTVRSHLRNIYSKTNTSGQSEVIALITAAPSDIDNG